MSCHTVSFVRCKATRKLVSQVFRMTRTDGTRTGGVPTEMLLPIRRSFWGGKERLISGYRGLYSRSVPR